MVVLGVLLLIRTDRGLLFRKSKIQLQREVEGGPAGIASPSGADELLS